MNYVDPTGLEDVFLGSKSDNTGLPPGYTNGDLCTRMGLTVAPVDNALTPKAYLSALENTSGFVITSTHTSGGTGIDLKENGFVYWSNFRAAKIKAKVIIANGCVAGADPDFQKLFKKGSGHVNAGWKIKAGNRALESGLVQKFVSNMMNHMSAQDARDAAVASYKGTSVYESAQGFQVYGDTGAILFP